MPKILNRSLKLCGESVKPGSTTQVTVLEYDVDGNVARASGATVPSDGEAGYAVGCRFIDTTGGVGGTEYVNEGTAASSCDFNVSVSPGTTLAGLTDVAITAPADASILVYDTATALWRDAALSGALTIGDTGVVTLASDYVTNAMVKSDAAIAFTKLAAVTAGSVVMGNAGNVATVTALSGDVAITSAGLTTVSDLTISGEAQGDILYRNALNWVRLAAGTAGQGLVTAGAGSNPYWGAPAVATASSLANSVTCEAGANDYALAFGAAGGAYTLTVPAVGGHRTFAFIDEAQTVSAAKLHTADLTVDYGHLILHDNDEGQHLSILVNENMTGDKSLTIQPNDADRTIHLHGNIDLGGTLTTLGAWTQTGAHTIGITTTNNTAVTLPTSGTLATLTGSESLSTKTLTAPKIVTGDGIFDAGGDELLLFVEDSTPVNFVQVESADAGLPALVKGNGSDANVNLKLYGKASGCVYVADGTDPSKDLYFNVAAATADKTMQIVSSQTNDRALTLPDATDTLVGKATTDVFTNKSFDCDGAGNVLTNVSGSEVDPVALPATEAAVQTIPVVFVCHVDNEVGAVKMTDSAPFKMMLIRAWSINTSGDGGTWSLLNNASTAMTDVVTAAASDKDIDNAAQIDDAQATIDAGQDLFVSASATLDAYIFAEFIRID